MAADTMPPWENRRLYRCPPPGALRSRRRGLQTARSLILIGAQFVVCSAALA